MTLKEIKSFGFKASDVLSITFHGGGTKVFIFYSQYKDGITGYGMNDEGPDLQFIPLEDIETITIRM